MSQDLENIEVKIAYLEETVDQLNDVVTQQSKDIESLWRANQLLNEQLKAIPGSDTVIDSKPPHY